MLGVTIMEGSAASEGKSQKTELRGDEGIVTGLGGVLYVRVALTASTSGPWMDFWGTI